MMIAQSVTRNDPQIKTSISILRNLHSRQIQEGSKINSAVNQNNEQEKDRTQTVFVSSIR
jgi:hypothetical protein